MKELFKRMCDALRRNEDLVLCSIVASSGSTPRGSGAKMVLFADGSSFGTVGGGAVEYQSLKLAEKALREKSTFTAGFNLTKNETADIGMICGGEVTVYFQYFRGGDGQAVSLFGRIVSLYEERKNSWLITRIGSGGAQGTGLYVEGEGFLNLSEEDEKAVSSCLKPLSVLTKEEPAYYVEPLTTASVVYVFGGGHVSQELVPVLVHTGFSVTVFEDRAEFARPELFPGAADVIIGDFGRISDSISVNEQDYVVIVTRGHQADYETMMQMLSTDARYIGMIGSRRKVGITFERALQAGIPEEALSRVHAPIGLPIGGETPAEIAISIAGELIALRSGVPIPR